VASAARQDAAVSAQDRDTTDFGFERVSPGEKTRRVASVFHSVADRYDVMNDLMSAGTHRIMKRVTVEMSGARSGHRVLDLAGGTGDLAALFAPIVRPNGRVTLADINPAMLGRGRDRLLDAGIANVDFVLANAERLPFADGAFNVLTIAFGLRNVTDKERALREMHRVLAPGGRLLVLEFSKPENSLVKTAYAAFQALWPSMGRAIVGDAAPYRYLVESIEMFPDQRALKLMLGDAGFVDVGYENLLNGIAAIHYGTAAERA
jgi:demethylmenaquinone methyltransferase/2-methoxy-6-polyprenyl-1,4-benzoquinol methylase